MSSSPHPLSPPLPSQSHTVYIPFESPPTPAPSPGPSQSHPYPCRSYPGNPFPPLDLHNPNSDPASRRSYLLAVLASCTPSELLFISTRIAPLLKCDFLFSLPPELAMHVLRFVDEPRTLSRAAQVSRRWSGLVADEQVWRRMCARFGFIDDTDKTHRSSRTHPPHRRKRRAPPATSFESTDDLSLDWIQNSPSSNFSYKQHFKDSYITRMNWRQGGHLLRTHRLPIVPPDNGVVTSLALDKDWVVVGLTNSKIHVFSARTGVLTRTLVGHELGVWGVCLVSSGGWREEPKRRRRRGSNDPPSASASSSQSGTPSRRRRSDRPTQSTMRRLRAEMGGMDLNANASSSSSSEHIRPSLPQAFRVALGLDLEDGQSDSSPSDTESPRDEPEEDEDPGKPSDMSFSSVGWGQPNSLVVSGGCDKVLRVWDIISGHCIYVLSGHTSTIRCMRVLHNRPIAVSGSRDTTLRVWDVQRNRCLRVLEGHTQSVRCLDVCGNRVVSGSYDNTCRVWDVDTGECIHVLTGHYHQIYSVAFDGVRIASGGLDTTVRVWDAKTGQCLALLQGHTALVCQLQLSPTTLATGGSDGRVITFSLTTFLVCHRIAAHDSSVSSLQFDKNFLVTGGNDGRVKLFEAETGSYVRDLSEPCESVWKVGWMGDVCAVMGKRSGKTVIEVWSFSPGAR